MTSHFSYPPTSPDFTQAVHYTRSASRPSTLAMNLSLGNKAKLAITNSLGKINQKLRMTSFSGTYSGVIQNQSFWNASEQRVWVVVLLVGVALLYGNRLTIPLALPELAAIGDWNIKFEGFVLVSFYWGYLCAPLLGHFLSDRCGGETVQWVAAIGWSLGTMLTVQFAPYSRVAVIVMQFLSGFTQGLYLPALLSVITRRTPDNSRGFLFSIIVSGGHLGSGLIGILHPLTTQQTPPSSWSTYFFLLASIVGVVWALLVRSLLQCSVKHHKTHYKLSEGVHKMGSGGGVSTGGLANGKVQGGGGGGRERLKLEVQPLALKGGGLAGLSWKSLRSPSVIVVFIVHFSSSLFLHLAMSWLPSCWDKLFSGIDHSQVWMFNVVPWVAMVVSSVAASWTCQWLISRKVSTTLIRCTLTSLSLGGSTLFLFIITIIALTGHAPFSVYLICTMIVYFCHGLSVGGYYLNPLDLAPSPSQAGLLFSAMETVGATAGIVSVHLAAITVTLLGSPLPVLILVALLNLVAFPLYLVLGSSKQFGVS